MSAIDRDVVINKYINPDIEKFHNSDVKIVLENLKQNILKMPSADRPQGKWFINDAGDAQCPICGEVENAFIYGTEDWYGRGESHFCPNCGARMIGVEDDTI